MMILTHAISEFFMFFEKFLQSQPGQSARIVRNTAGGSAEERAADYATAAQDAGSSPAPSQRVQ